MVNFIGVADQFIDSLSDFGLIRSQKINFTLDAKFIASSDAWLRILTLSDEEGELGVGFLNFLVIVANEGADTGACGTRLAEDETKLLDTL